MAKTLDSFDFSQDMVRGRYPWDTWMDGRIWQLKQGKDFRPSARSFRRIVLAKALKRGQVVQVAIRGDYVVVQAEVDE